MGYRSHQEDTELATNSGEVGVWTCMARMGSPSTHFNASGEQITGSLNAEKTLAEYIAEGMEVRGGDHPPEPEKGVKTENYLPHLDQQHPTVMRGWPHPNRCF